MRENNDLHMQVIQMKEELQMGSGHLKERNRQLENENADMQYLTAQKDKKNQELERNCLEMRQKL